MEDKERFIRILKRYKLADFDKINSDNVNRFWDELNKHYAQDTIRKIACDLKSLPAKTRISSFT